MHSLIRSIDKDMSCRAEVDSIGSKQRSIAVFGAGLNEHHRLRYFTQPLIRGCSIWTGPYFSSGVGCIDYIANTPC